LDWSYAGLAETLQTLREAGLVCAGAGQNAEEAETPAMLEAPGKGRVLPFSFGSITSGIPQQWGASDNCPGVNLLDDLSEATAIRVAGRMRQWQQPGDVMVVSIHWGSNWGYEVPKEQVAFAHRLIDEGVAVVHGHSSHHMKAIEVYRNRLILYGCGDFLTDYEGITGYEIFRGNLALMYLVQVDPRQGQLAGVRLVPMRMRRFQATHVSTADAIWLRDLLNRLGATFGTHVELREDNSMNLVWR
jgi:poly-gamma-glutamate synthesis protein (capsule biosynthesis protein)